MTPFISRIIAIDIHKPSSQLKGFSLPRRSEGPSYSVDCHIPGRESTATKSPLGIGMQDQGLVGELWRKGKMAGKREDVAW